MQVIPYQNHKRESPYKTYDIYIGVLLDIY